MHETSIHKIIQNDVNTAVVSHGLSVSVSLYMVCGAAYVVVLALGPAEFESAIHNFGGSPLR